MRRWLFAALAVLMASPAFAAEDDPCVTQRNTIEMNECSRRQMQAAEDNLNSTYRTALASLEKQPGDVKKQLVQAQRNWIKFRDTNCNAVLAKNADASLRTVLYLGCMQKLAEERTEHLKLWFLPQH